MRVLLTGAGGFIGSHVARRLLAQGDEVIAVLSPSGSDRRISDLATVISIARTQLLTADLDTLVTDARPDLCIHLAWHVDPARYLSAVQENLASLAAGARLLSALDAAGCARVVTAGTCLEPGTLIDGEVKPSATIYASAKDALHRVGLHLTKTSFACAHVFYLYGPGEESGRLVPTVIRACLEGRSIDVSSGEQRRDFLHVEDVAAGIVSVAKSDLHGRVDVCSGATRPLRDVFDAIGSETGRPDLVEIGKRDSRVGEPQDIAGDSSALSGTGWRPRWSLETGIAETVEWWRDELVRTAGASFSSNTMTGARREAE
jgi:nucleoside-diphosphate-sugar epimerase